MQPNRMFFERFFCKAVTRRFSLEKVFLEVSQKSQENTCARGVFWHRRFLVNFVKFLRTLFFTEHLWWLVLKLNIYTLARISFKAFASLKLDVTCYM